MRFAQWAEANQHRKFPGKTSLANIDVVDVKSSDLIEKEKRKAR